MPLHTIMLFIVLWTNACQRHLPISTEWRLMSLAVRLRKTQDTGLVGKGQNENRKKATSGEIIFLLANFR